MENNHADKAELKGMAGATVLSFMQKLMDAKKQGKKLPKALDKLAAIGIKAEAQGKEIAIATGKEKLKENAPLIIVSTALLIVIILYLRK